MKVLFVHRNFPGVYLHIAPYLAQNPANQVFFITNQKINDIPNVRKIIYSIKERPNATTHPYLREYEDWILHGQAAAIAALNLKKRGFKPDIILACNGGPDLFIRDIYPDVPCLGYFEWYTNSINSDLDFNKDVRLSYNNFCEIRIKNSSKLTSLMACDHGITPTYWQLKQFPEIFHSKLSVIHEGIHTHFFRPAPGTKLIIPDIGLDLSGAKEIVTYATAGMEPYRGFPQFMEAASMIQQRRQDCHIVVGGGEAAYYSKRQPGDKTFKELMLEKFPFDLSRLHFTGILSYPNMLKLFQASHVHIYLTYPYILSWSLLEAMSAGCLVISSDTEPVKEVIEDHVNGLLVDFFSPGQIADKVDEIFTDPERFAAIRENARRTVIEKYDAKNLLNQQLGLINRMIEAKAV